jgi:hypothetical protein
VLVCIEPAANYPNTERRKQVSAQTPAKSLAGMIAAQVRCRADVHAVRLPDALDAQCGSVQCGAPHAA